MTNSSAATVLVVDDEPAIRDIVRRYLEAEGLRVVEAADGEVALKLFAEERPSLVVLDVGLPIIDGVEVLRQVRTLSMTPVLMLSARVEEADRVIGLSVGADDYVTKPFSARELTLRVKNLLRRSAVQEAAPAVELADLTIDTTTRDVKVRGRTVELSALEFSLLQALASAPRRVFTRRQLLERVWGDDYYGDERVVDVHIRNLRKALGDDAENPRWIGTVRGVGYRFEATS
ncbi:MAG TPA: response regulator transcription factor [Ilumatobacteraceae bacterium]|nr:response regulator transcription factor [Ilumatobacteraceae bacterium]